MNENDIRITNALWIYLCADEPLKEEPTMEKIKFNVSEHFLPALINADFSGISNEDELLLDRWEKQFTKGYYILGYRSEPSFQRCEVTNLMSNCVTITVMSL